MDFGIAESSQHSTSEHPLKDHVAPWPCSALMGCVSSSNAALSITVFAILQQAFESKVSSKPMKSVVLPSCHQLVWPQPLDPTASLGNFPVCPLRCHSGSHTHRATGFQCWPPSQQTAQGPRVHPWLPAHPTPMPSEQISSDSLIPGLPQQHLRALIP